MDNHEHSFEVEIKAVHLTKDKVMEGNRITSEEKLNATLAFVFGQSQTYLAVNTEFAKTLMPGDKLTVTLKKQ